MNTDGKITKEKVCFVMEGSTYADDHKFKTLMDMLQDQDTKYHIK